MVDPHTHHEATATDSAATATGGFHWQVVFILGFIIMALLAISLWRRVQQVDPVQRCQDAYESSYNAVDTTLVDRIRVRSPNGGPRTTCGALRLDGSVDRLPRRSIRNHRMP